MLKLAVCTLVILSHICYGALPPYANGFIPGGIKTFAYTITPDNTIKETLLQCFKCKQNANKEKELKKLYFYASYDDTSSCNDWKVSRGGAFFNMTLGNETLPLQLENVATFTVHLNGNLMLYQIGNITNGICAGGFWEKFVVNIVDQSGCSGTGVSKHIPLYALAKITGGRCDAVCPGKVSVWFDPPIRNVLPPKAG